MKIISWNCNSLKARMPHVLEVLEIHAPDILFLQELKGEEFPIDEFAARGYYASAVTQKAYNGVAVLTRGEHKLISKKLDGDEEDLEARFCAVDYSGFHFINVYLPNGNPVTQESLKFPYKLKWMRRLIEHVKTLRQARIPFLIGGDFNIIPEGKDCFDETAWRGDALFHEESLKLFYELKFLGLTDAFRVMNNNSQEYTFWDYQAGAWQRGNGIRIDHFLTSPALTDRIKNCTIDKTPRGWEKPSDHTPIILELNDF